jgi:hypothetical protein
MDGGCLASHKPVSADSATREDRQGYSSRQYSCHIWQIGVRPVPVRAWKGDRGSSLFYQTVYNLRIVSSNGYCRDIDRMVLVSCKSIPRKRTNCSICKSSVFLPYPVESFTSLSHFKKRFDQLPTECFVYSPGISFP